MADATKTTTVTKSRTGTWGLGRGTWDSGTRGRGDAGTRGLGDAGTWGRGDSGTWDASTHGPFIVVVIISKFFANFFHCHKFQRLYNYRRGKIQLNTTHTPISNVSSL